MRIIFLLLFIGVSTVQAQSWIKGNVTTIDGIPIAGVKLKTNDTIVYSSRNGNFVIQSNEHICDVVVTHVQYESQQFTLTNLALGDTLKRDVKLRLDENVFNPVIVDAKIIKEVYKKENVSVMDFDFFKDELILLVKDQQKYALRILDESSGKLDEIDLWFKPIELKKDCFSNIHIVSADSNYQVNVDERFIYAAHSIEEFETYLEPCIAEFDNHLFMQIYSDNNQTLCYYQVNKSNKDKKELICITDEASSKMANYYDHKIKNSTAPKIVDEIYPGGPPNKSLRSAKDHLQDVFLFELGLTNEIYHPVIKTKDSMYLFDHLREVTSVYDQSGNFVRSFPIQYNSKDWIEPIFLDAETEKVYLLSSGTKDNFSYQEISLKNGALSNPNLLKHNFMFSRHTRVHNGQVYFLYHTSSSSGYWKLYKYKLKS